MTNSKYTKEVLEEAVKNSESFAGVVRFLGLKLAGGTQTHIANRIRALGINHDHFKGQGWNKNGPARNKKSMNEILVLRDSGPRTKRKQLLRAMIEYGFKYVCECGQLPEWNGVVLTLEIDHISGEWLDDRPENLRFLCPNCHSQQAHTNMPHKYRDQPKKQTSVVQKEIIVVESFCNCGKSKTRTAKLCRECEFESRAGQTRPHSEKIKWPEYNELQKMVDEFGYSKAGRELGVSDNAIRKRLKNRKLCDTIS